MSLGRRPKAEHLLYNRHGIQEVPLKSCGRGPPTSPTQFTAIAGNVYRLFASGLARYEAATPDRLYRHFVDATGTLRVGADHVTVELGVKTYTPVLLAAGYRELDVPIPWWEGRRLRVNFPPR